jgi:DNA polymerase III sliding clamp (beta) subunit (PCNA family)
MTVNRRTDAKLLKIRGGLPEGQRMVAGKAIAWALKDTKAEKFTCYFGSEHVSIDTGLFRVTTKYGTGQFPNYGAVLPREANEAFSVDRKELTAAIKEIYPYLNDVSSYMAVAFSRTHRSVTLDAPAQNDKPGKAITLRATPENYMGTMRKHDYTIVMPMREGGKDGDFLKKALDDKKAAFGIKGKYFRDAVSVVSGERVFITTRDPNSALLITGSLPLNNSSTKKAPVSAPIVINNGERVAARA